MKRATCLAALTASAVALGGAGAWAGCHRSGVGPTTALDLVPLATGTAISSMIATINAVNASSLAQSSAFATAPTSPQEDVAGGGRWSRVIAGTDEVQANTKISGSVYGAVQPSDNCESTTRLNYIGTQAGVMWGRFGV
ncbi:MAG: hypothetical protein R3D67_01460 [Hyphomicrobiaceae bacterium]